MKKIRNWHLISFNIHFSLKIQFLSSIYMFPLTFSAGSQSIMHCCKILCSNTVQQGNFLVVHDKDSLNFCTNLKIVVAVGIFLHSKTMWSLWTVWITLLAFVINFHIKNALVNTEPFHDYKMEKQQIVFEAE